MPPHDPLTSFLAIALFCAHGFLLFRQPFRMGSRSSDRSAEPWISRHGMRWAFLGMILLHGLFTLDVAQVTHLESLPRLDVPRRGAVIAWTVVAICGLGLRLWAIRTLGRFFTFHIGIRENHGLVHTGPYRLLRHPSYTGYLLFLAGVCGVLHSWVFFAIAWLPACVALLIRVRDEERMLAQHFQKDFTDFARRTWALIPWVW